MALSAPAPGVRAPLFFGVTQSLSLLGSELSTFGLGVWAYQQSGSVTTFALVATCGLLPGVLLSPVCGALADRWDRRRSMLAADLLSGLGTAAMALLFFAGRLEVWHVYLAAVANSLTRSLQEPAFSGALTLLFPPSQLGRVNGLLHFGASASMLIAPALAGLLIDQVGLHGVLLADLFTFSIALVTLLLLRIPHPPRAAAAEGVRLLERLTSEIREGLGHLLQRRRLKLLLSFSALLTLVMGFVEILVSPLLLELSGPTALGTVLSAAGLGAVAGSVLMMAWGGPEDRATGSLAFGGAFGLSLVGVAALSTPTLMAGGGFVLFFWFALLSACTQAFWQEEVPEALQGRMYSTRKIIGGLTTALAFLLAGPLAERLFQPLVAESVLAAPLVAWLGTEKGLGIRVLLVLLGILTAAIAGALTLRTRAQFRAQSELAPSP